MANKIYIDAEFKCHVADDGTMSAVETDFFDGKCDVFIEGYRYVPSGASWTRDDGKVFTGEMISPWKDYAELDSVQREYEQNLLAEYQATIADMETALNKLGVTADE